MNITDDEPEHTSSKPEDDKSFKEVLSDINNKINNLSIRQKVLTIVCMLTIMFGIWYLASIKGSYTLNYYEYDILTKDKIIVCSEEYIKWELITEPCPQNKLYFHDNKTNFFPGNFEDFIRNN
jgi:hypothetical protein